LALEKLQVIFVLYLPTGQETKFFINASQDFITSFRKEKDKDRFVLYHQH